MALRTCCAVFFRPASNSGTGAISLSYLTDRLAEALGGRYTIGRELGRGGMATVYLAEDLHHRRNVAIKVLRPEVSALLGAERFLQEIAVTANLQHPNILPLFDSGRAGTGENGEDGAEFLYYVMPYVEGESLRDALNREKQLSVEDAISLGSSVAAALQYAHEHGVVHRDIKPENILIQSGQALVSDFGIALAIFEAGGDRLTQTGLSVGTPAYMSPEQATAEREVDGRSDVYSLGCVVYEMLTGEPPHTGRTAQAVIARILAEEPALLDERRRNVPPHVGQAVHRALQKLPADRFRSARAFGDALSGGYVTPMPARKAGPRARQRERVWMISTAVLAVVSVLLGIVVLSRPRHVFPGAAVKVLMTWPPDQAPRGSRVVYPDWTLSPDGTRLAYVGPGGQLWLRMLNELSAHALPGTAAAADPFFSADGRSVGFFTGYPGGSGGSGNAKHSLRVVPVDGGPVRTLVEDSADVWGGDWSSDGMVYYTGLQGGIWRVPAAGGPPQRVSRPDSAGTHLMVKWVDVLPNGKGALFSIWRGSTRSTDVGILNLATSRVDTLFPGSYPRYAAPGYVLYATPGGALVAVPFDEDRLAVTGAARPVADSVVSDPYFGKARFAISETGTLLYSPINTQHRDELVWVGFDGSTTPVDTTLRASFHSIALSPDGRRIAVAIQGDVREDIWVKDLRLGSLTRLSLKSQGSVNYRPEWTADGRSLTFVSDRAGPTSLWVQPVNGSAPAKRLASDPRAIDEGFLSPDGAWAVYRTFGASVNTRDIYAVRVGEADTARQPLAATAPDEYSPALSPGGRWLAYVSEESGRAEVYVRPFPNAGTARWLVSVDGGRDPVWDHSGRRLFYEDAREVLMEVDVSAGADFTWSPPHALFDATPFYEDPYHPEYALAPDGRRFLMVRPVAEGSANFVLSLNWSEELR